MKLKSHAPSVSYLEPRRKSDGRFIVVKGTNFGDLDGKVRSSDVTTRRPFRGFAVQAFDVTETEGMILHSRPN